MLKVGVIGYGYWGPNLVRNFAEANGARVVALADRRPERLRLASERYPGLTTSTDPQPLVTDPEIDAVVIATPVSTHYELALQTLEAGKHVLVEKPLAASSDQAARLIDEAARRKLTLMVDHTFVYTEAVEKVRELVASDDFGDIYYYDSVRVNMGLFQHDVNVLFDLASHDLSIMDYVLPMRPTAVSATGLSHIPDQPENIAYLTLFFDGPMIGHIHVNWLAPVKVRHTLVSGSRRMVVYNDLEPSEKVKVYDRGITLTDSPEAVYRMLVNYRIGDMWAPHLHPTEALGTEVRHFIECVETGDRPLTDGEAGLRVVRTLEAATESLAARGRLIEMPGS